MPPWNLDGNNLFGLSDPFLGSRDAEPLTIRTSGQNSMIIRQDGLVEILEGGATVNDIAIGTKKIAGIDYSKPFETVGISNLNANLRLQSPNSIFFHTGGDATPTKPIERLVITEAGSVGIGTTDPVNKLDVNGDVALSGKHALRGSDTWLRLNEDRTFTSGVRTPGVFSSDRLNVGGVDDPGAGNVRIAGNVGIGTPPSSLRLDVVDRIRLRQGGSASAGLWLFQSTPAKDRAFIGMANDTSVGLWGETGANWGLVMNTSSGNVGIGTTTPQAKLDVAGGLGLPTQGGGYAEFTKEGSYFFSDSSHEPGHLKLSFGFKPLGAPEPQYAFAVGHIADEDIFGVGVAFRNFWGPFEAYWGPQGQGVNVRGKLFVDSGLQVHGGLHVSGGKTGYVADHFINGAGDVLEQGDVVVISSTDVFHYSGADNNIPLPEVTLTDKAYDSRACGIVAEVVTESELPFVEEQFRPNLEDIAYRAKATEDAVRKALELGVNIFEVECMGPGKRISVGDVEAAKVESTAEAGQKVADEIQRRGGPSQEQLRPFVHPLAQFAGEITPESDVTRTEDQQMGRMVTLGTFAHCKVDADIAPIEAGDLLTTSPTKRHARKVVEPEKAVGAIIGKALASLREGKGMIPVLVILH